jgi:alpha-D-xyloside xylohydrolase
MPGLKAPGPPPAQVEQTSHGLRATAGKEVLEVTVCTDSVIHVVATPEPSAPAALRPWMLDAQQSCPGVPIEFTRDDHTAEIKTAQLNVTFNIERGNLSFGTAAGESLLNEGASIPRTYEPVEMNGDHTYRVADRFSPSITEGLYGLGQHQSGMFNYRGATVELGQDNTDVAIPLLISSKGYGLMWNTAALTYFDNRFPLDVKLTSIAGKSVDYYFFYGPQIEYAAEDPAGPIELRICRGADGKFDLYEDAGDGYEYEKGQHSVIPIRWDDRSSSLTIGARKGSYPGMIEHRKFRVVLVGSAHGVGVDPSGVANAEVSYEGQETQATIR